ncbi:MAG: alpha/beta hydrolase [Acidobacteriota bacterium]|nr:alpha/beta hydrolase [Acidobacteriota bacterium]MDQ7087098.1 alpha/beta hydrolase [Acidobacteriota bacterium]
MSATVQHRLRKSHGYDIFVRDYPGDDDLAPLVFVHGLGESGLCFEEIAMHPLLAARRRLVPDLPGYGRSPWPERPLPLAEQARWLAAWIAESCSRPPVLVGHSMGGVVAQLLAEARPGALAALIDVDGNLSGGDCTFSSPAAATSFELFVDHDFRRLLEQVYEDGRRQPALRGYYASLRLAMPAAYHLNARELVEISAPGNLADRLARLETPVIYIAGSPGGASEESLELLARARIRRVKIGPAGHWPFVDQQAAFAEAVAGFLATAGL